MERSTAPTQDDTTQDDITPDDTDAGLVERSVELDLDVAAALDAVARPERLSTWLGRWTETADGTTVVTDDGVARAVRDLVRGGDGVRWTWSPLDGGPSSDVTIAVAPLDGGRSRVTVREVRGDRTPTSASASATTARGDDGAGVALDGLSWAICLLALEIAAAARSLAVIGAG